MTLSSHLVRSPASRRPGPSLAKFGPWALVTGASSGIGRAIAERLATSGFDLVLTARRESELNALAATLAARHGIDTRVVTADLSTPEGRRKVRDQGGDLDLGLVVLNAGFGISGALHTSDAVEEQNLLELNCLAVLDLSRHFANRLVQRGGGGMVLISSIVAMQGVPGAANYAASKAYVHTLGEGLHAELRPHGVHVLVAAPGPVASGFGVRARLNESGMAPDEVAHDIASAIGRRRIVRPGRQSKLLGWPLLTLPRWARSRIMGRVIAGFTRQHQGPAESPG